MEMGHEPPESCVPPDIPEDLVEYTLHFWRLSTCRSIVGQGYPGPIPWTAIDRYARQEGIGDDEVLYDDMVTIIEAMDSAYLEHVKERAAANGNSQVVPGKGAKARTSPSNSGW